MTLRYYYIPSNTTATNLNNILSVNNNNNNVNVKLYLCVYRVIDNHLLKAPVLSFFLTKNENLYGFPSFTMNSKDIPSFDICSYLKSIVPIDNIKLINSYKCDNDIYVFLETDKTVVSTDNFKEFVMSEIINHQNSSELHKYNITDNVPLFFCRKPTLAYLYNSDGVPYETPIIGYKTGHVKMKNYMIYSDGMILDDLNSFYTYSQVEEEKNESDYVIYKYILFIGAYQIIPSKVKPTVIEDKFKIMFDEGITSIIYDDRIFIRNKLRQYLFSIN